ncbi:hypothetical protein WG922_16780 [Ramlibacter sp. AN1015]|uniref:hypothetical protein n=1 Tax=Ramlibacter sp. AN1015 TaxID=3133428 RepID=UPI0030BCF4C9
MTSTKMLLNLGPGPTHVEVGGDFARVFDPEDYLTIVNALDEQTVVLRAHLILEEFLNIWAARLTGTEDLFAGTFVPFSTKLSVCVNLGLDKSFAEVLDRVNTIRNRYSHRRKYKIEQNAFDALRRSVDDLAGGGGFVPCEQFELLLEGVGPSGERRQHTIPWGEADMKKRLAVAQVVTVLKTVAWMQDQFRQRGIEYTLIASAAPRG